MPTIHKIARLWCISAQIFLIPATGRTRQGAGTQHCRRLLQDFVHHLMRPASFRRWRQQADAARDCAPKWNTAPALPWPPASALTELRRRQAFGTRQLFHHRFQDGARLVGGASQVLVQSGIGVAAGSALGTVAFGASYHQQQVRQMTRAFAGQAVAGSGNVRWRLLVQALTAGGTPLRSLTSGTEAMVAPAS